MSRLAERITSAPLKRVPADCPEWNELAGETLYVREMTGAEREGWEAKLAQSLDGGKVDQEVAVRLRWDLIVSCLVDGSGEQVFESTEQVKDLSGDVGARVATQVMEISGLTADIEAEAGN